MRCSHSAAAVLLDVAGVVEVGLERQHELLVAAVEQPAQPVGDVVERRRRERGQQPVGAQVVPARDVGAASAATRSAASARR